MRTSAPRSVLVTALVAVLVTVAAMGSVLVLRVRADRSAAAAVGDSAVSNVMPSTQCGNGPCQVLSALDVKGTRVELLADGDGGNGRFRVGGGASQLEVETAITALGVRLNQDSLRCVAATTAACVVRGPHSGGMAAEVLVARADTWRASESSYFSDAGAVVLGNVLGDDSPEVIVVRHDCTANQSSSGRCPSAPVLAEVFDLAGQQLGCTRRYTSPGQLRGWPEVRLVQADLRHC